jgi:hypothetical protein
MGWTYSSDMEKKMITGFRWGDLLETGHSEHKEGDGRMTLGGQIVRREVDGSASGSFPMTVFGIASSTVLPGNWK